MKKTIHTEGKRKKAVARATLWPGTGKVVINRQKLENWGNKMIWLKVSEPLSLAAEVAKTVNLDVKVTGGGANGQAEAARLAIARALAEYEPKLEKVFDDYDRWLLVADVRHKETRKPNDSKARAARQKSYR